MPEATDLIRAILGRGIATRADLQRQLKVSQPTLSRAINRLGEEIFRIGGGRSTRYALRREFPKIGSSWPVFVISDHGEPSLMGRLHALARDQYGFTAVAAQHSHVSDGLPFFLQDLWPQGFMGRTIPKRFPELELPERINDWNDRDVLTYLTQRGDDSVGNIMIGDESLQRYLKQNQTTPTPVESRNRSNHYSILADSAIAGAPAGSSAAGEHPKFTTCVEAQGRARHVIVKFSPARTDPAARRWSDLLVAEHLACQSLATLGVQANATDLIVAGNRMFLEAERFDRVGIRGRVGVVSLAALADHYIGRRDNWMAAADSLQSAGKLSAEDADAVHRAATFGQLIGNSDMHFGNLSFFMAGGRVSLAPIYDMLPMIYAPIAGEELPDRDFDPPMPIASNLEIWTSIAEVAAGFWRDVASHTLISKEFASIAAQNAEKLLRVRSMVPG
jgi:hypothetical protein